MTYFWTTMRTNPPSQKMTQSQLPASVASTIEFVLDASYWVELRRQIMTLIQRHSLVNT